MTRDIEDRLWDLADEIRTCMMVSETDGAQGAPALHARPMHAIVDRETRSIWFYTELVSGKTEDLAKDGDVCLTFACPKSNDYVSVSGRATVTQDREKIREHWSRFVEAWLPEGPESESVGMIRVDVTHGEYWDSQSSKVLAAVKMLIASETGERPDITENRKLRFG